MRKHLLLFFSICFFSELNAQYSVKEMRSGGALHPLQANMDIRHINLNLTVDPDKQTIDGFCEIDFRFKNKSDSILLDLAPFYNITSITVNNTRSEYRQQSDRLFIAVKGKINPGNNTVRIDYHGKPPVAANPPWEGGFTWQKDKNGNPWIAINCQSEGGKIYFPCKDHPSDEPDEGVDMYITVPRGLSVAGPGMLGGVKRKSPTQATWHWKTVYPISNYCILFNIGKYKVYRDEYTTINGNTVPMEYYVLEEDTAHARQVLQIRARDTKILEKYFGEYPWVKEKIGIAEVPNPGMEHQTMITFANNFTMDTVNGQLYHPNLYHEFGHEWWANKVTNNDWAHMWIQEGINTYAETLFFLEVGGERAYDSMVLVFKKQIDNDQPVIPAEVADSKDVYSSDIYMKGAFFMHSLRFILGDSIFFPALKALATDPAYTYNNFVGTTDVEKHFSKAAGTDLSHFFNFFLRTTKILEFSVSQKNDGSYQVETKNFPMELPLEIAGSDGTKRIRTKGEVVTIKSSTPPVIDPRGWYLKKVVFQ